MSDDFQNIINFLDIQVEEYKKQLIKDIKNIEMPGTIYGNIDKRVSWEQCKRKIINIIEK